ncbi:MAG: hypothetical protein J5814_00530 [Bacteroidaceae bacterium]|nr:hypothetical protein [Bacteroidaceae bacterium]
MAWQTTDGLNANTASESSLKRRKIFPQADSNQAAGRWRIVAKRGCACCLQGNVKLA